VKLAREITRLQEKLELLVASKIEAQQEIDLEYIST